MQFDRYLFGQMIRTTIAVSVTLVGIMWLFQTIRLLEVVINRGAPISNFLLMSVTVIPLWLTIAVPVSAFVAVIWVFQRAVADRELLVMQASGRSALQLARAPLALGILLTLVLIVNSVMVLPQSFGIYKRVQFEVRNSIPTVMLQDNVFIDVVDGLTMLIGEKLDDGLAKDLFIHDERTEGKVITMTARVGQFVERDGLPAVILQEGERIELSKSGDSGATLLFDTHTVTIAPKDKTVSSQMPIDMNEDTISNLLNPEKSPYPDYFNQRRAEGHYRIVSPALALVLILIATVGALFGQVRRHTWSKRTLLMIVGSIVSISALVSSRSLATSLPSTVPLLYASVLVPSLIMLVVLTLPSIASPKSNIRAVTGVQA
ncbi:MAG: LptF/LptG family permease [Pseudomonadota bacterium]|nr:LptF/LptG family permease [Pseudomonadota bacterium]MEC7361923.1 LptF/LptG family permease [Pseudomonadota bacterium]MEC7438114.1 LptF/LptG family permease [Pseudomonadota bacterium]MEC7486421.1 LptF/LptG family permease [Pseudomonadota bacterium]MEC7559518.1 LptF/LptG family permease [Pseudomonadota bacterium]